MPDIYQLRYICLYVSLEFRKPSPTKRSNYQKADFIHKKEKRFSSSLFKLNNFARDKKSLGARMVEQSCFTIVIASQVEFAYVVLEDREALEVRTYKNIALVIALVIALLIIIIFFLANRRERRIRNNKYCPN